MGMGTTQGDRASARAAVTMPKAGKQLINYFLHRYLVKVILQLLPVNIGSWPEALAHCNDGNG